MFSLLAIDSTKCWMQFVAGISKRCRIDHHEALTYEWGSQRRILVQKNTTIQTRRSLTFCPVFRSTHQKWYYRSLRMLPTRRDNIYLFSSRWVWDPSIRSLLLCIMSIHYASLYPNLNWGPSLEWSLSSPCEGSIPSGKKGLPGDEHA